MTEKITIITLSFLFLMILTICISIIIINFNPFEININMDNNTRETMIKVSENQLKTAIEQRTPTEWKQIAEAEQYELNIYRNKYGDMFYNEAQE